VHNHRIGRCSRIGTRFVEYRGVRMVEGWAARITEAESIRTYSSGGKPIARIPYGSEQDDWGPDEKPCHDCRVFKGELHVVGCDAEECPLCHTQLLSCACAFDDRPSGAAA